MLHFATLFDINYLTRGLALIESLQTQCSVAIKVFVLSLDDKVSHYFLRNTNINVEIIELTDIEQHFPELAAAKANRKKVEYYFTLSPYLPLYILEKFGDVSQITTLDADILFFSDPVTIFNTYPNASVLITPHDFHKGIEYMSKWGSYNVSFQSFKKTAEGLECLRLWKKQCLEWCHDEIDATGTKFADQKYLDAWPLLYKNLAVIDLPTAGLAPWNIGKRKVSIINNKILVDGNPLIYYHFHGLRFITKNFVTHSFGNYNIHSAANSVGIKKIYQQYVLKLKQLQKATSIQTDIGIARYQISNQGAINKIAIANGVWFINPLMIVHFNFTKLWHFLRKIKEGK